MFSDKSMVANKKTDDISYLKKVWKLGEF